MSDTSQEQRDANTNAQFSTGPRSEAGKSRVSQNARTHGLTGERLRIELEDQEAYDHQTLPSNISSRKSSARCGSSSVERSGILQSEKVDAGGCDGLETEDESLRKQHDRLERYRTRAQNSWIRCRKILRVLQNERIAKQTQSQTGHGADDVADLLAELQKGPPAAESTPPQPSEADSGDPIPSELGLKLSYLDFAVPEQVLHRATRVRSKCKGL